MTWKPDWKDLGLTYEQALHGVQTGVMHEMHSPARQSATEPKHLRVGINAAMSDHAALAFLLVEKGIFTKEEYFESLRLAMNNELARYEACHPGMTFR